MNQVTRRAVGAQLLPALLALLSLSVPSTADAQETTTSQEEGHRVIGVRARGGGRFDNVRMCVATAAGVKGGPAADISFFVETGLSAGVWLDLDLPVFRPILFAASFDMLQFEPTATVKFRMISMGNVDLVGGPTLGLSLHYGPDYTSDSSGVGRKASFFALGPIVGGYVGLDVKRPGKTFNLQLGVTPYVTPLFGVNDPQRHRGLVAGASLDASFRFAR